MITFQEWLEDKDPETYNEFLSRFLPKKAPIETPKRGFTDKEKIKLARLQGRPEPGVPNFRKSQPRTRDMDTNTDSSDINWVG